MNDTKAAAGNPKAVPQFTIEIDHPRNCDVLIQSIPNLRLRSRMSASRTTKDAKSGRERIPVDQARHLGMLPETPGMQLTVTPAKLEYQVVDKVTEDQLEQIHLYMVDQGQASADGKLKKPDDVKGQLDVHRMKTLCRECFHLVEAGEAKIVDGPTPKMENISKLPGKFLLNPGSRVHNSQPTYEEDFDEWVENLAAQGG